MKSTVIDGTNTEMGTNAEMDLFFEGLIQRARYYEEMDRSERKLTYTQTRFDSEGGFPIHG